MAWFSETLGVSPSPGGRHEGLGTHNAILPLLAGAYVELIAADPTLPAPAGPRPFGIDGLEASRLATWAVRTAAIDEEVVRIRSRGYEPGDVLELSRATPGGELLRWKLALPRKPTFDGLVPFLIDWGDAPHPSATDEAACTFHDLAGVHPEPELVRQAITALGVSLPVESGDVPALRVCIRGPAGEIGFGARVAT